MTLGRFLETLGDLVKRKDIEPFLNGTAKMVRFRLSSNPSTVFCPITAVEYFQNGVFVDRVKANNATTYLDLGHYMGDKLICAADHTYMCDDTIRMRLLEICKLPTCSEDK